MAKEQMTVEVIDIDVPIIQAIKVEDVADFISKIASVVYDRNEVQKPMKRFGSLLVEAYDSTPSSVLEFVPCVLRNGDESDVQHKWFGYFVDGKYYTNMRELLNWGWSIDECLKYVDFTNYKVVKCTAPYFVFGQLSRHKEMAVVSHSQRYAKSKNGYWYPEELEDWYEDYVKINKIYQPLSYSEWWGNQIRGANPDKIKNFMKKDLGVKRKEIFDRGVDMLELRSFCLGGYTNNPYQWNWLMNQRLDSHTQEETRQLVKKIKKAIL